MQRLWQEEHKQVSARRRSGRRQAQAGTPPVGSPSRITVEQQCWQLLGVEFVAVKLA